MPSDSAGVGVGWRRLVREGAATLMRGSDEILRESVAGESGETVLGGSIGGELLELEDGGGGRERRKLARWGRSGTR